MSSSNVDSNRPFTGKLDDANSFSGSPSKKRAWEKVNENKRVESLSPTQKADNEKIAKIKEEMKEEELKRKQIEADYREQIKALKKRHEDDLSKMQPPKNLDEERKELLKSLTIKLDREIERIQKQHEANIETEQIRHKNNLEREKLLAEQHSEILKRQLEQQIQIADLVRNVQGSSTKLESILKSNMDISESGLREKQKKTLELEKTVNEKLTSLVLKQRAFNDLQKKFDNLNRELESLRADKFRKQERDQTEQSDSLKRFKTEENRVIQEITLLKLKVENQKDKQKRIEQILSEELQRKESELEDEKTRFEREKQDAQAQQREYEKKIQLKYMEIDERKKQLNENESYLLKKIQNLDHKYDTVKRESEALRYKMEQIDEERVKFEDKAYQAQQTSIRVFEESEYVAVHKKEYEEDRAELEKLRYELEAEKAHVRAEHLKLEHKRTEILMRERMLDQLKLSKVQDDLETQQRMNYTSKGYYDEPMSGLKSGSDFYRGSYNMENFSPNKLDYPKTVQNTVTKDKEPRSASAKIGDLSKDETEVKNLYNKLNESIERTKQKEEQSKRGFDFNSYDNDDDDDDDSAEDE